jgi:hypothetical protein
MSKSVADSYDEGVVRDEHAPQRKNLGLARVAHVPPKRKASHETYDSNKLARDPATHGPPIHLDATEPATRDRRRGSQGLRGRGRVARR